MQTWMDVAISWRDNLLVESLIYSMVVLPAFIFFWWLGKKYVWHRRIQPRLRANSQTMWHDIRYSLATLPSFAVIDVTVEWMAERGYTRMYENIEDYGWTWWLVSIPVMLVIHDAYFYWAHRLMHHPALYKYVHKTHHLSTDPTPFTSYAFHPLEALMEQGIVFVIVLCLPVHLGAIFVWQGIQMIFNVIGHLGIEIYPRWWLKAPILHYKTPSTHHNMHHARSQGNYGLYFSWWDRWMGTEFKDYEQTYNQIFERSVDHKA